jgi:hypothetical protein
MVKFLIGAKGSGKTKKMLDMANEACKNSNGSVVYVDRDRNHIYDLDKSIRFIETGDFQLDNLKAFYGFLCGVISQNFDTERIFIDGHKLINNAPDTCLEEFVGNLKKLGEKFEVSFVVSCSRVEESIPEFLKAYI